MFDRRPPPPPAGSLEPPAADLLVDSRRQAGVQGTYSWEPAPGQSIIADAVFPIPDTVLSVRDGEAVRFAFAGQPADQAEIEIYPVPEGATGRVPEAPAGAPRATVPLSANDGFAWTVDLPKGEYLLLLRATWPAGRALYGFRIAVEARPDSR